MEKPKSVWEWKKREREKKKIKKIKNNRADNCMESPYSPLHLYLPFSPPPPLSTPLLHLGNCELYH